MLLIMLTALCWYFLASDTGGFASWAGKVYMPRRVCMYGEAGLINTHLYSDLAIAIAYSTIPVSLIILAARRKDLLHKSTFIIFACFILFCGITHIMNILAMYKTYYRWDAIFKVCCAIASVGAAATVPFVVRDVLKMPTSKQMKEMTEQLKKTQKELESLKKIKTEDI